MSEPALHECIAAVSAEFHSRREGYDHFYQRWCDDLAGFPGIWSYCMQLGIALHEAEQRTKRMGYIQAIDYDWVQVVIIYAERAQNTFELLDPDAMVKFATDVIIEQVEEEKQ